MDRRDGDSDNAPFSQTRSKETFSSPLLPARTVQTSDKGKKQMRSPPGNNTQCRPYMKDSETTSIR